jgi:hypothetical protein
MKQPPAFAARLLKRLVPAQDHDALLGDLAEEAPRRSRIWYWSQLLAIVVVASWRDVRRHPLLVLRAIATGFVALTLYFGAVQLFGRVINVLANGGYYIAGYWLRLSRPLGPPPPYDRVAVIAIIALGFILSGWAVVRFHRAHGISMAMPFLVTMTSLALIPLAVVLGDTGPGTRQMPVLEIIVTFGTLFGSVPGGILLGGYVATLPAERT